MSEIKTVAIFTTFVLRQLLFHNIFLLWLCAFLRLDNPQNFGKINPINRHLMHYSVWSLLHQGKCPYIPQFCHMHCIHTCICHIKLLLHNNIYKFLTEKLLSRAKAYPYFMHNEMLNFEFLISIGFTVLI